MADGNWEPGSPRPANDSSFVRSERVALLANACCAAATCMNGGTQNGNVIRARTLENPI
jgi:hypothetical protein